MPRKLTLFCDGASRGNPGPSSYGYVIFDEENQVVAEQGRVIGSTTNNVAEYEGLIQGLEHCKTLRASSVTVKSDSQLLVRQLTGQYKVKTPHIAELFHRAKALLTAFSEAHFIHIPREENKRADKLANAALDGRLG
jgi:ribonuclease HI